MYQRTQMQAYSVQSLIGPRSEANEIIDTQIGTFLRNHLGLELSTHARTEARVP